MIRKIKKTNRRKIIIILILVLILGVGAFYFTVVRNSESDKKNTDHQNNINYSPPTKEELEAVKEAKDKIIKEDENQESSTWNDQSQKRTLNPVISGAEVFNNKLEITSYVQNTIDEGQCTATISKGNIIIERKTSSTRENSTSYCHLVSIDSSEIPEKGTWSVVVKYSSSTSEGISAPKTFEIR